MSKNKKTRIAKGLGASALAIATLASGLSFGTAAATAAPATTSNAVAGSARTFPLIFQDGTQFVAINDEFNVAKNLDIEQALTQAARVQLEDATTPSRVVFADGKCLVNTYYTQGDPQRVKKQTCAATTNDAEKWTLTASTLDVQRTWAAGKNSLTWAKNSAGYEIQGSNATNARFVGQQYSFNAEVKSVDIPNRTAIIEGRGNENASIVLQWGDGEYEDDTRVNDEGVWDFELDNLKLGSNPVKLLQYENQQLTGEYELDVELKVAELTVKHEFGDESNDLVTLSGTAQGGAVVQVFNEQDQMVVASEPASTITGEWSVQLPAPNKGGTYDLNVFQSLQGERTSKTPVSIDYGKQLVVTRPANGSSHPGGQLDVRGTGEPSAKIEVHEGARLVGSANVRDTQNWSVKTLDLDAGEHRLTVTQKSKGGNVQTEMLVVNEGDTSVPAPTAQVVFDQDVTKKATISGSAQNGATVTIRNAQGTVVATPSVSNGSFSAEITAPGTGSHDYTVVQTAGEASSKPVTVTADYGVAVTAAAPATSNDAKVTLTGTGQNGQKVSVTDADGKLQSTTVANGTWSLTGAFRNGSTPVTVTGVSKGALTTTADVTVTVDQVRRDLVIETPTKEDVDNGKLQQGAGEITFTGTATPFAEITMELWNGSGTRLKATADGNGKWSGIAWAGPSTYTPVFTQSVANETNSVTWHTFSTIEYQNLTNVRPTADDLVQPSRTPFTGNGSAGAEIEIWTGPKDSSWARMVAKTTVKSDNTFGVVGALAANNEYHIHTYQTMGGKSDLVVNTINTGAERKETITNIAATNDGNSTTITGKANPNTTVEFWTGPKDTWGVKRFEMKVDAFGHFSGTAWLSAGNSYTLHGYQSYNGAYFGQTANFDYTPTTK